MTDWGAGTQPITESPLPTVLPGSQARERALNWPDPPEEIHPEIVWGPNWNQKTYRIHLPRAGSFRCSETKLGFEVRAAVTIQYGYDSWDRRLSAAEKQQWMVASPLFDIWVEPAGAMTAIHLPHFLCLAGAVVDVSHLQVARFVDCGMTLESPTQVRPFHAVLENPSFSPIGVLWKQIYSKLFPPVHTLVLLYRSSQAADITLHLYLIPRDRSIAQAIEDNEMKYQSKRVRKPSKSKPLYFGSCSFVSSPSSIEVIPKELEFCNMAAHCLDPDMEIYTRDLGDKLELSWWRRMSSNVSGRQL
ncbi:NACHT, LRR and PYD domains-containing protein 1-like [Emydura macquarii macquarii]|uniref:NACHT, LRR and PYD domains-containing protein 1-like n=1 Tax=Emydura macquarii macquarii TaxID=1129001 RepID=UPI003529FE0C